MSKGHALGSVTFLSLLSFVSPISAQQSVQTSLPRDPQAIRLLTDSLSTMLHGVDLSQVRDTYTAAQRTSIENGETQIASVIFKTLGTKMLRVETDSPDGKSLFVISGERAALNTGAEAVQRIPRRSVGDDGITHLSVLSVLSSSNDPGVKLQYLGLEKLGNASFHHVRMQRPLTAEGVAESYSPYDIYIEPQSLLVARLQYMMHAPTNLRKTIPVQVEYTDYRSTSGILVPFHITYTVRQQKLTEYALTSFSVNSGISVTDFELR